MHSLKQTVVAVVLLGVSFGLYHFSLIPSDATNGNENNVNLLAERDTSGSLLLSNAPNSNPSSYQTESGFQPLANVPVAGSTSNDSLKSFGVPPLSPPTTVSTPAPPTLSPNIRTDNLSIDDGTQFVQREPVTANRDLGLIEALKNQPAVAPESMGRDSVVPPDRFASRQFDQQFASRHAKPDDFVSSTGGAFNANANAESPIDKVESLTIRTVWEKVDQSVESQDFHTALKLLSRFYKDETLTGPQRQRLMGWLDALAAKVIFSSEDHLVSQPYVALANESLVEISKNWQVPPQLIANIHRDNVSSLEIVPAGMRLKQVPGPFHAELKLNAQVITLFLGDIYAGRFPVVIGTSGEPKPGTFDVVLKSEAGYIWRDSTGKEFPPGTAENGYGPYWIGLSGSLCVHAVAEDSADGHAGCIGLSPQDAMDLFSILSEQSKFTIVP